MESNEQRNDESDYEPISDAATDPLDDGDVVLDEEPTGER
ncbi:hypothetical protein G1C97_0461 [Bifidobacterium sp. DSM 109959]|uniref:Uncharacterized protein n=1 Tax=Bifidobacterium olomucense TaxID=2675324 RepID=A0A7Y0EW69_9BIFI|nr:hypothetical protein [Bifidobacterium sp. DSM 109959]